MKQLSTIELQDYLHDPKVKLIDTRPIDAYNGWRLREERRGGHIRGARTLPNKWLSYIEWPEIVQKKGLVPEDALVIYGYEPEETQKAAEHFQRLGFNNLRLYHDFVSGWSENPDLGMERLAKYQSLVPPEWLDMLLQTGTAPEYRNEKFVLCHAHYQNKADYDQGHIPGAIEIDTNTLESQETWNRRSPNELKKALEAHGIRHNTTVVLYGRFSFPDSSDPFPGSSSGHLAAMRCAFIMMYAGVKDVRVLNGGLQAWVDAGNEVSTEETPKKPVSNFGVSIPKHPEYAVDIEEARQMIASPDANLVSVRSWREWIGEVSGYNYIEKKGRIPGAVLAYSGSDPYHLENYRNLDHTMREYHELEQIWADAGITPDKHNAFYCGTGWRGSEAFLNAWRMGWPRVSVFDGGWFEWSNDETNPIETGHPQEAYA